MTGVEFMAKIGVKDVMGWEPNSVPLGHIRPTLQGFPVDYFCAWSRGWILPTLWAGPQCQVGRRAGGQDICSQLSWDDWF